MRNVGSVCSAARSLARRAFERRIARLLGMDSAIARELVAAAWRRDDGRMTLRAMAFLAATVRPSPLLVPRALRERAIHGFVRRLLVWQADDPRLPLAYAGHARDLSSPPCPGLLSS